MPCLRHEMTASNRLYKIARAVAAFAVLLSTACSGASEVPPELAPGTFAGQHVADIEYNCAQAQDCAMRQMEELADDSFEQCVSMVATTLNASTPADQLTHLVKVNRCRMADSCRYISCATLGGTGFGEAQIDKVTHSCRARVQCAMDMNALSGDADQISFECLLQRILQLDSYTTDAQSAYQSAYWPCASLQSCAFTSCFLY